MLGSSLVNAWSFRLAKRNLPVLFPSSVSTDAALFIICKIIFEILSCLLFKKDLIKNRKKEQHTEMFS